MGSAPGIIRDLKLEDHQQIGLSSTEFGDASLPVTTSCADGKIRRGPPLVEGIRLRPTIRPILFQ